MKPVTTVFTSADPFNILQPQIRRSVVRAHLMQWAFNYIYQAEQFQSHKNSTHSMQLRSLDRQIMRPWSYWLFCQVLITNYFDLAITTAVSAYILVNWNRRYVNLAFGGKITRIYGSGKINQPDRPFHDFKAWKSVDPRFLASYSSPIDGFRNGHKREAF